MGKSTSSKKGLSLELSTIIVTAFAAFLWISVLSYHTQDPSFFTQSTERALNACGPLGAYLSSVFLQFFGLATFLIPVGFLFVAAQIHTKEGIGKALSSLAGISVSVMALTIFLSVQWKTWHWSQSEFLTGGMFGAWLSAPLEQYMNRLGASIVSLALFLAALVVSTPIGVAHFLSKFIHSTSIILFRLSRLVATYVAYYSAVALNKLAQFIGIQARKSFEQIRDRAEALRLARTEATAALPAPAEKQKKSKVKPSGETEAAMIISAGAIDSDEAMAAADLDIPESHEPEEKPKKSRAKKTPLIELATSADSEDALADTAAASFDGDGDFDIDESGAVIGTAGETETSIISASDLRKQVDMFDEGPYIEKTGSITIDQTKPKFKFDKKRGKWKLPILDFLRKVQVVETAIDKERLKERARILTDKLAEFGIDGEVTAMRVGPVITLYEFKPGPGIKVSRIAGLVEDLSMALSSRSVRILAPLPGKAVVGIEIPSENREQVLLREFLQTGEFQNPKYQIPVIMGKDIAGQAIIADLARMPHLLVSGQTGSGKSVFVNGLLGSLLYRFTPDELRLILVDPKFIEFSFYHDIPHLLLPVVDDPKNASSALKWATREMERRYRILEAAGVRNLQSYNDKVDSIGAEAMADILQAEAQSQEESGMLMTGGDWIEAFEKDESSAPVIGKLPYIVIVIDELADLMMTVKKDVEGSVARIAQKARAAGVHLVIATQRPSTDVITGLIKANMPTRVSFSLSSQIDSRTILDRPGAERLLGQGDMLFIPPGSSDPIRLQGAFFDDGELNKITDFLRDQGKPSYRNEILIDPEEAAAAAADESGESNQDPLFEEALYIVRNSKSASASFLQRRLQIGYNRAARIIEMMEERGIVGPADGARPREILMP
ncbi:MAG: DNA translocase FtsK 4TM domain-containing protein [Bdellovibrionales bacterium]|nr:DNA translocase FtsK 4TM domain-containing protein [Bdellovibrionales bacterium]